MGVAQQQDTILWAQLMQWGSTNQKNWLQPINLIKIFMEIGVNMQLIGLVDLLTRFVYNMYQDTWDMSQE